MKGNEYSRYQRSENNYKYVNFFLMFFITIFIVCDTTAFRMVDFFGFSVPASGLVIPLLFTLGDVIAEVYGYPISRKMIWNSLICQFFFGLLITLVIHLPSPSFNHTNINYSESFKHIIRTNITSCFSVSLSMFTNAVLMSKFKIWMNGKKYWLRTILSSIGSEFVLCFVAYTILFTGLKDFSEILDIIAVIWIYKMVFAFVASLIAPFFTQIIKKAEQSDVYDYGVNYNPFLYNYVNTVLNEGGEKELKKDNQLLSNVISFPQEDNEEFKADYS